MLVLVVLWGAFPVFADDAVNAAVNRLSTVDSFAFGGVGIAGVTSKGEIDFKLVLAQPQSIALGAFEKLYATGNPQGKAYALSGLRKLAPQRFKELATALRKSPNEVQVMRGCIISHEALFDVAQQIDQGNSGSETWQCRADSTRLGS
jgi:hypothetical protein